MLSGINQQQTLFNQLLHSGLDQQKAAFITKLVISGLNQQQAASFTRALFWGLNKQQANYIVFKINQANHDPAIVNNLGMSCLLGTNGMPKSALAACRFFFFAASKGNTFAKFNLGRCYFYGEGAKKDLKKAQYWLDMAYCDACFRNGTADLYQQIKNWMKEVGYAPFSKAKDSSHTNTDLSSHSRTYLPSGGQKPRPKTVTFSPAPIKPQRHRSKSLS